MKPRLRIACALVASLLGACAPASAPADATAPSPPDASLDAAVPAPDASFEDPACARARTLATAGAEGVAIDFRTYLALPPSARAAHTPVVWTDVDCFEVRVSAHTPGESFALSVFSGRATDRFEVTPAGAGPSVVSSVPVDLGEGVRRFDFVLPVGLSDAVLDDVITSSCADGSPVTDANRYRLRVVDLASTAALDGGECVGCLGCPGSGRCASPRTHVATDRGPRPIASLRVGDLVWSADERGFVLAPLVRVTRTPVSAHHVVRVVLDTGAVLEMSPGHPLAEGGTFADLRPGTRMGEARVVSATRVAYAYDATYDVLPESATGTYVAEGALVGSTLQAPRLARQGATGASPETKSAHP